MDLLLHEKNSAFDHDMWSRWEWLNLLNFSPKLGHYHKASQTAYEYSFPQDSYYALTGSEPNASPIGKKWTEVMQQDFFPKLVERMTNRDSTINTTIFLAQKFEEHYLKEPENPPEEQKGNEQQKQKKNPGNKPPTDKEIANAQKDLQQDQKDGEGDTEASEEAGPQAGGEINAKVAPLQITDEEIEKLDEEIKAFDAMSGLLAGNGMSPKETRQWVEHNFDRFHLERLADLIGFGQRVMDGAARNNQGAVGEFTGYMNGGLGSNTSVMDRISVTNGSMLGMARLADRKLTNRKYDQEKPSGKGAAVILHDESSSMKESFYTPTKDQQAINLQLALGSIFTKQGRPYTAIAWDDHSTRLYEYGKPGLEHHLKEFLGGGTELGHAINKAITHINQNPEYATQADILVISDGEIGDAPMQDTKTKTLVDAFRAKGGRIWFILVGAELSERGKRRLQGLIDFYIEAKDLNSSEGMAKILEGMATDRTEYESTYV